jgi:hypothetical protein
MAQFNVSAKEPEARFAEMSLEDRSKAFSKMLVTSKPVSVSKERNGLDFHFHVPNALMQDALAICQTVDR